MRRRKLSTRTSTPTGDVVPWLAASGPLAYTPESPPERDYYFQYGWVLPGIFAEGMNLRSHYYFGALYKAHAADVFAFWRAARAGRTSRVAYRVGRALADSITAPIAVYEVLSARRGPGYMLVQHGSYQAIDASEQPVIESGEVLLYRGIQKALAFRFLGMNPAALDDERRAIWRRYTTVQSYLLSDALRSFNSIHDRAKRCETSHLRDGSWMSDDVALAHGLDIEQDGFAKDLWTATHQGFTLERSIAENKFGPNYVVAKTPLDNIRMTTFVAGELEVRIVDPGRLEFVEENGCRIELAR